MNYVILKLQNGKKYNYHYYDNESVSNLKNKIEENFGIKKQTFKLMYKNKLLQNGIFLNSIPNKSRIYLVSPLETINE